jgi:hypothetical protein
MSYLLNYKNWRAIFETAAYGQSAILPPFTEADRALLDKFLVEGARYKTTIVETLNNLKILFNVSTEEAADYLLVGYLRKEFNRKGLYKKYARKDAKWEKDAEEILNSIHAKIDDNFTEDSIKSELTATVKLNQGADPKTKELAEGKVLTKGEITNMSIDGSNTQLSATTDIAKYLNTFNLANHPTIVTNNNAQYSGISIDSNGAVALSDDYSAGSTQEAYIYLFALADYTPPTSKTVAKYTPPFTVTTPGAQTIAEVKDAFEVLDVVPKPDKLNEVIEFIDKVDETGIITKIEVIGGASTEAVAGQTAAGWATKYGVTVDKLPADNVLNGAGVVGKVVNPKASGNAWLAMERGTRFANAIKVDPRGPDITPIISAEIGADAANSRFVKIVLEVKAKDNGTIVPGAWVVNTMAQIGQSSELGGGYTINIYFPDFY